MSHTIDLILTITPNILILGGAWLRMENRLTRMETVLQSLIERLEALEDEHRKDQKGGAS